MKQREVSHDSDDKPPKAKAKVQIKKQRVQLPGHQNPIEVPTVKPPKNEEDDEPHPNASSSNDPTIPLPTTTAHSFTPAQPEDEAEFDTPQSSQDTIPYQDVETEEPIIIRKMMLNTSIRMDPMTLNPMIRNLCSLKETIFRKSWTQFGSSRFQVL